MSEIKGQLLGIIIVLMVFAAVSGAMVALFNNLTKSVSDHVSEVVTSSPSSMLSISDLE